MVIFFLPSAMAVRELADSRKKITIATTHSTRLDGPMRPAVVSQRSATIAVMLNSTTSRSVMTRGSCVMGPPGSGACPSHPEGWARHVATLKRDVLQHSVVPSPRFQRGNYRRPRSRARRVHGRAEPADPAPQGRPGRHVGGKVLPGRHP